MKLIVWKFTVFFTLLLALCGSILISLHSNVLNYILVLRPNTTVSKYWINKPMDLQVDLYMFNWTNPQDIYNKSVKPKFEQVGPYKFKMTEEKKNVVWNKNGTVSYKRNVRYYFDETALDNGNLDYMVTNLNPMALSAAQYVQNKSYFIRKSLSFTLSSLVPSIYTVKSVREWLIDGYPDPLIKIANSLPIQDVELIPKKGKFKWFALTNGSDFYGTFNMGTGINSTLGKIYSWNYQTTSPYFKGSCANIQESTGEVFHQDFQENYLRAYSSEIRRTVTLKYTGRKTVDGVEGRTYETVDYTFDNGTIYPENKCFCDDDCLPSGQVSMAPTMQGISALASLPHFTGADPVYANSIEGIHPDVDKYKTSFVIEPTTGVPLELYGTAQLNLVLKPIPSIRLYENVPRLVFPIFWVKLDTRVPNNLMPFVKVASWLPLICYYGGIFLVIFGLVSACFMLYCLYGKSRLYPLKKCKSSEVKIVNKAV